MSDHDDAASADAGRLADARYILANHIVSGEPLDDYARTELLVVGLVTDADLGMLPNPRRYEDPGESYEYIGRRWDASLDDAEPVLVERGRDDDPPSDRN